MEKIMQNRNFETKWNWGAFIDGLGFGIGNKAYWCLLVLIPILNIIWIFVCGAKAEGWALNNPNNNYRDEEEFRKIMDTWKRAGFIKLILAIIIFVAYTLLVIFGLFSLKS